MKLLIVILPLMILIPLIIIIFPEACISKADGQVCKEKKAAREPHRAMRAMLRSELHK